MKLDGVDQVVAGQQPRLDADDAVHGDVHLLVRVDGVHAVVALAADPDATGPPHTPRLPAAQTIANVTARR